MAAKDLSAQEGQSPRSRDMKQAVFRPAWADIPARRGKSGSYWRASRAMARELG